MYKYKRKLSALLVIVVLLTTNLGIQVLPQSLKGGAENYLSPFANAAVEVTEITLPQNTVGLTTGQTKQLSATVVPSGATNKQINWSVFSGSEIVSASETGLVEALKPGTAVVRATSAENSNIYKDCTITVSNDDYGNTTTSAYAIGDNTSIHGKIQGEGDSDFFAFTAKAGAYEITTSSDPKGEELDTYLHIYNSKGDEIATNDTGYLGYGYACIKLNLTQNETYYIKMRLYYQDNIGDYILNVHPLTKPEITLSQQSAALLTGEKKQLNATIVTPAANKQVIWSVTSGSGIVTVSALGLVEALKPGKAVVRVTSGTDDTVYEECNITVSDDDYPNTIASAFAITSNSAVIHGKIEGNGDCDYFKFTPTQAGLYEISTSSDPAGNSLDTYLNIYDSEGKEIAYNDTGEGQSSTGYAIIKMRLEQNQTYYIKMRLYYYDQLASYILNIKPLLKPELTISQTTTLLVTGQEKQLSVDIITPDPSKRVLWTVTSGSGIASVSALGLIKALNPGTAVVRVTSGTDDTVYKECTVIVSNDDYGSNMQSAHEIDLQSDCISINGKIEGEGDFDYFKFTAKKTGLYTISTSDPAGGDLDTYLHLYASDGTEIITDDQSGNYNCAAIKNIKLTENKTYYIKMRLYYSSMTGSYILSFIPPVDIILSQSNVGLEVGKKLQLIADVKPDENVNQDVTWKVMSGSEYVSVSSTGEVEALKAGTATVRVTSVADSTVYKECTVIASDIPLASIDTQNVTYDNNDIIVKATLNGCTLNGIINNKTGNPLVKDQDYTMSDITTASAIVTIKNSYLTTLTKNTTVNLTFDFNNGLDPQLSVNIPRVDECFIATAAFGSKFQPAVAMLRQFRDKCLLTNSLGTQFVNFYYKNSPPIAKFIAGNDILRGIVRGLLVPFIAIAYGMLHPVVGGLELLGILFAIVIWRKRRTKLIKI